MGNFDFDNASPDEIRAEAERRWAKRNPARVTTTADVAPPTVAPAPAIRWVQLAVPFAMLASDNTRSVPIIAKTHNGRPFPRLVLSPKYRKAKAAIRAAAKKQLPAGFTPFTTPCAIHVLFHEPDRARVRDIGNWAKQIGDALSGVVYRDDGLLDRILYERGAVSDLPGAMVVVEVL